MCNDCRMEAARVREQIENLLVLERERLQLESGEHDNDDQAMAMAAMIIESYTIGEGVAITMDALRELCLSYAITMHKLIALQQVVNAP